MKIITRTEWSWDEASESYVAAATDVIEYHGPIATCTGGEVVAAEAAAPAAESALAKGAADASIAGPATGSIVGSSEAATSFPVLAAGTDTVAPGLVTYGEALPIFTAAPAASTILGMTPKQWGQQALFQGGATGLQWFGEKQKQNARERAYSDYQNFADTVSRDVDSEFTTSLNPFQKSNFNAALDQNRASEQASWDQTRPRFSPTTSLPGSTPDTVVGEANRRVEEQRQKDDKQFGAMTDLNSFSNLLGLNSINTAEAAKRIQLARKPMSTAKTALESNMKMANGEGSALTGLGNMTSSIGNLMLASQLSKKGN